MKTFYKAVLTAFKDTENIKKYTEKGLKAPRIIDLYNGQDFNPEYFDMVTLPALYLSSRIDYSADTPIMSLTARLMYEQLRNTSNIGVNLEQALYFFDMAQITDTIIRGVSTENTGKIRLLDEGLELEPTVSDVYVFTYECKYYGKNKTLRQDCQQGFIDEIKVVEGNLFKGLL
ncbi:hypothetical protein ACQ1Q1_07090 [Ornithobacterium rhinotracheale]|uniref:hypothetical protein n=2 Tax=Ornithobacterium rhinotracheale TaxID=28251 RepID=UPI004035CFD5